MLLDGYKIQGQGITAIGVTNRTLFLLLSTGPTKEGRKFSHLPENLLTDM